MDQKDFQILVELHKNARQSYRSIGFHVELSAPAVRERLRNLKNQNILQGYWLSIDPSIFNRDNILIHFRGEWTRRDLEKVLAIKDVAWAALKLDGGIVIQIWSHDKSKSIEKLTDILGKKPSTHAFTNGSKYFHLSSIDWQIIEVLVDDPKIPLKDLIKSTQLSPKTIRKHLELLLQEEIISIMPLLGNISESGEIVYNLAVIGNVNNNELYKVMGDSFLVNETHVPPMRYFLCHDKDFGSATSKTQILRKLPKVESVVVSLNREMLIGTKLTHDLVREKIGVNSKR